MGIKLTELDIKPLPRFMRKVRMMMIPSVGYFTVASKCDHAYLQFINEGLTLHPELASSRDEDLILETLLGETL